MRLAVVVFTSDHTDQELQLLADKSREGIQEWIRKHISKTGKLAQSIRTSVYGRQIVVESDVEYAKAVDQGILTSKSMWHLINRVIPLKLKGGRTVFRKVTAESILRGKWKQKPRPGADFVRRGLDLAKSSGSFENDQIDFQIRKET